MDWFAAPARRNGRFGSKADIRISRLIAVFISQPMTVGRSPGEQVRQLAQVNAVTLLERSLTDGVLLDMVITAEADRPAIRRLEGDTPISITADVSALDRAPQTTWDTAVMAAHPGAVSRALTAARRTGLVALKPVRELESGHVRFVPLGVTVPACSSAAPCVWRILRHLVASRLPRALASLLPACE